MLLLLWIGAWLCLVGLAYAYLRLANEADDIDTAQRWLDHRVDCLETRLQKLEMKRDAEDSLSTAPPTAASSAPLYVSQFPETEGKTGAGADPGAACGPDVAAADERSGEPLTATHVVHFERGPVDGAVLRIPVGWEVGGGTISFRLWTARDKTLEHVYVIYTALVNGSRTSYTAIHHETISHDEKPFSLDDFDSVEPRP